MTKKTILTVFCIIFAISTVSAHWTGELKLEWVDANQNSFIIQIVPLSNGGGDGTDYIQDVTLDLFIPTGTAIESLTPLISTWGYSWTDVSSGGTVACTYFLQITHDQSNPFTPATIQTGTPINLVQVNLSVSPCAAGDVRFAAIGGSSDPCDLYQGSSGPLFYVGGTNANDAISISNSLTRDCNPAPVTYLSFTGKEIENQQIELNWATASEENSDYFIVERRYGSQWEALGTVTSAGNSNQEQNYRFIDEEPNEGINYYRLKQVDFDGKYEYSKTIQWSMVNGQLSINVAPNPANNKLIIINDENFIPGQTIQLYDIIGKPIFSQNIVEKTTKININTSGIANGNYILVIDNNITNSKKIVIQH